MKILDFGSGTPEHAYENWIERKWLRTVQTVTRDIHDEVFHILCFDPLCIEGDCSISPPLGEIAGTCHIQRLKAEQFDTICLIHPNPGTVGRRHLRDNETFQTNRYLTTAMGVIESLPVGGHVITQFDDEMRAYLAGRGVETFLERLMDPMFSSLRLKHSTNAGDNTRLSSDIYTFDSLHVLEKVAE